MAKQARRDQPKDRRREPEDGPYHLYGLHAVAAALANPERKIRRVVATRNAWTRLSPATPIEPEIVEPRTVDRLVGADAVHQGIAVETERLPERDLDTLPVGAPLVILDQVTDPHNVGAILRSATALGAGALVTTRRNAPPETALLAKSASGALEHTPIIRVGNLASALGTISTMGYTTVGLDSDAEHALETMSFDGPVAIVLGAEGRGLRERTRESADRLARLDMPGPIRSLNVSNAATLALYVATRGSRDA